MNPSHKRSLHGSPSQNTAWADQLHHVLGGWPSIGIVLGSGLGSVADRVERLAEWPYETLPGLTAPSAAGHAGRLLAGRLASTPCLVAQGRLHLYEGHSVDAAIRLVQYLCSARITTLILTNAAGGLHPDYRQGDLMVVTDHLNLMFHAPRVEVSTRRHRPVYDQPLIEQMEAAAIACGFAVRRGVYAGVLGPTYETRAEYRMLRRLGADAVGMSTVPEALVASHHGLHVAALSVITNEAKPDRPQRVSHEEVVDWTGRAAQRVGNLLTTLVANLAD